MGKYHRVCVYGNEENSHADNEIPLDLERIVQGLSRALHEYNTIELCILIIGVTVNPAEIAAPSSSS